MFTYNPKAVEGQVCLESSPIDNKFYFLHNSRAIMLEVGFVQCLKYVKSAVFCVCTMLFVSRYSRDRCIVHNMKQNQGKTGI